MKNPIERHPDLTLYALNLAALLYLLWAARSLGVLGAPVAGMDQHTMLAAARTWSATGEWPASGYMYSPAYTGLLGVFSLLTGGWPTGMRILQAALCALLPVAVRNLAREFGAGRQWSFAAGLATVFYGALQLISLDFLRAGPLALTLSGFVLFLARGCRRGRGGDYAAAGLLGGLCVLGRETFGAAVAAPALLALLPGIRKQLTRSAWWYPAAGTAAVVAVVVCNGVWRDGWAIVPGHYGNVIGCYYGESATAWPGAMLRALPGRIVELLGSAEVTNSLSVYAHRELIPFLRVLAVPASALWAFGLLGIGYGWRRPAVLAAALTLSAASAALLLFPVFYRFRIPVMPLLAALSAVAGRGLAVDFRTHRVRAWTLSALAAGFVWLFWNDPTPYRTASERRAVVAVLLKNGRYSEAGDRLDELERDGVPCAGLRLLWRLKTGETP